ncbi:MAG: glycoside hydrolase family 88 protein [bacterium]|nr:glycoside hydrolase family 88 protein [bacterium]
MQRILTVFVMAFWLSVGGCAAEPRAVSEAEVDPLEPAQIRAVAARVADWQLDHPEYDPKDWTNAVFYSGVMAAYRLTGDSKYLEAMIAVGERAGWQIGARHRHADDHAIAQTYLELIRIENGAERYRPFQIAIDRMMSEPPSWTKEHQRIDYWWCDALFMSPPALAKLARATGDARYLDFMDRLWREAYDLLYDEKHRLFHRDLRFRDERDPRFWARGNGWVLAGLARLIDELGQARSSEIFYRRVFRDLAERIAELQADDGLWRSDLLGSSSSAPGESSASALFCFALAWGVHQGILDPEDFLPVVAAAWEGLFRNVDGEGRLGWVQKPGAKPGRVSGRHSEVYASGAFLLAAEQVLALQEADRESGDAI